MDNKDKQIKYSRTQQHELIMLCIYQYLFYLPLKDHPSVKEIVENVTKQPFNESEKFIKNTFLFAIKHCQEAVDKISPHLVEWEFERLCLVDQAVLILGYVELFYAKVPAPIVITTCVKMAQKFCASDSSGYINGVLDKLKNELS